MKPFPFTYPWRSLLCSFHSLVSWTIPFSSFTQSWTFTVGKRKEIKWSDFLHLTRNKEGRKCWKPKLEGRGESNEKKVKWLTEPAPIWPELLHERLLILYSYLLLKEVNRRIWRSSYSIAWTVNTKDEWEWTTERGKDYSFFLSRTVNKGNRLDWMRSDWTWTYFFFFFSFSWTQSINHLFSSSSWTSWTQESYSIAFACPLLNYFFSFTLDGWETEARQDELNWSYWTR